MGVMKGKKQPKKQDDESFEDIFLPLVMTDPRAMEKTMFDLTRLLGQQEFASEKEMITALDGSTPKHSWHISNTEAVLGRTRNYAPLLIIIRSSLVTCWAESACRSNLHPL